MGYLKTTIHGLSWNTILRICTRGFGIIRIAILARILSQNQFGLFGITAIVLTLLEIVTETGINVFLIQEKDGVEKYIDTAWVISIIRGFVIGIFILILAPLLAVFFRAPESLNLLYLTAAIPFVRGFINPSCVYLQKNLEFRKEFLYKLSILFAETLPAIILAMITKSAQSLVWALIVSALTEVILSFILFKPTPKPIFNLNLGKVILNRGKWITAFNLLDYIYTTGDNIIVGRFLGQSALGIYQNAYKLSTLTITEIVGAHYKVSFPIYSKLTGEPQRLKKAALKSVMALSATLLVSSLGIYFFAQPLVLIVLGNEWRSAIPVIKILAFLGFIRGTTNGFNSLFMAIKKQQYVTLITLCSAIGLVVTIIPLVNKYGIQGAAYSAIIGSLVALPLGIYLGIKVLHSDK